MNDFFNILFGNGKQEEVGETELIGSHSLQLKDRTNKARQTLIANREENRPEAPYPTAGHSAKAPYELDIDPEFQVPERPEAPQSSHYTAFAKDEPHAEGHVTEPAPKQPQAASPTPIPEPANEQEEKEYPYNNNLYVEENNRPMKAYDAKEVMEATTRYFDGEEMVANVWMNKYALRDGEGHIYERTPDDMHLRLAKEFARIEKKYPNPLEEVQIFSLMKDFKYIVPQGSPMFGIPLQLLCNR